MRILTISFIAVLVISCSPSGPITPENAFSKFKSAYSEENTALMLSLISQESKLKIDTAVKIIASMDENSKTGFSEHYGLKKEALNNLSNQDFLKIQIVFMKKSGNEIHKALTSEAIVKANKNKKSAEFIMSNSVIFKLQREFPYWKIDITFF